MFTIIGKNFEDYRLGLGFPVHDHTQKDFFSGKNLNDRLVISVIITSKKQYDSYYFDVSSSKKLIDKLDEEKIEGKSESLCIDELCTKTDFLKNNLEELIEKSNQIDYRQPFKNSFIIDRSTINAYDIDIIPSDTDAEEALIFGRIAIEKDSIDSEFDFYDYITETGEKDVRVKSCGYCSEVKLSTSVKENDFYKIKGTGISVCRDCSPVIRKKCAEFGDNYTVIKKIVSEKI